METESLEIIAALLDRLDDLEETVRFQARSIRDLESDLTKAQRTIRAVEDSLNETSSTLSSRFLMIEGMALKAFYEGKGTGVPAREVRERV